jgi:hypothetical protein
MFNRPPGGTRCPVFDYFFLEGRSDITNPVYTTRLLDLVGQVPIMTGSASGMGARGARC